MLFRKTFFLLNRNSFNHRCIRNISNNLDKAVKLRVLHPYLEYTILFFSGLITYKFFKSRHKLFLDRQWYSVNAATVPLFNPGGRKSYNFLADVVDIVAPAVVYIEIKDTRTDFFTGKPITISNGSGFIVKSDGLIITNAHVVAHRPSSKMEVRLHNGKVYPGVVEDIDAQSDLATVRINATQLPVMKLGDSNNIRPGEFVVALGSPLTLSNTVTAGVVSSSSRGSEELGIHGKNMVYIQTDAAITFGNSGGPLVNLDGEAIGVNSMKVTAGISFAIPSNYVKRFLSNAKGQKTGLTHEAKRRYLGITMVTLTPQIIHQLQIRSNQVPADLKSGVLVYRVFYGSPAHVAGLKSGDIVTHINGKPLEGASEVYEILSSPTITSLSLILYRAGRKFEIAVTPETV